ncbi:Uncharacterized protein SCF082_LOCUS44587, partial [Durusdinium trenchii]
LAPPESSPGSAASADAGPRRFTMTAYDGGLLQLPNVPVPVVVDLAGMQQVDQVKALLHHDPSRPVGHMERIEIGQEIECAGVLSVPEHASTIEAAQANGFEWEASIGAQILEREAIPRGRSVSVNGRTFQGPLLVARKTLLREVSFTGAGAGQHTSARIAAEWAAATAVSLGRPTSSEFRDMPDHTPSNTPQDRSGSTTPETPTQSQGATQVAPESQAIQQTLQEVQTLRASYSDEVAALRREREAFAAERERIQRERLGESVERFAQQYGCEDESILASLRERAQSGEISENDIELQILRASGGGRLRGFTPLGGKKGAPATPHVIEAALCLTSGWDESELEGHYDEQTINAALGHKWVGFGLHALAVEYLQAHGHHVIGGRLRDDDLRAMIGFAEQERIEASGGFSTLSLPGITSNVARKEILRGYDQFQKAILSIAKRATATDYKPWYMYRLNTAGLLEQVGPDGELKSLKLTEDAYQSRVYPFGRKLAITDVMWKNDDAGAFRDLAALFGLTAARTVELQGFTTLLSKQDTFWTTDKGNRLADGAGSAVGLDAVQTAFELFLKAKDSTGQPIGLRPRTLLTSSTDFVTAMNLNKFDRINLAVRDTNAANEIIERTAGNPFRGMFDPQYSPYLDNGAVPNANGTQWLLCADPNVTAPIVVAYLDGRAAPQLRTWESLPGRMGMQWDITLAFGFNMHDERAEQLGALAAPSGTAVYEVPKATGASEGFSDGDAVYWDATNSVASNDDDTGNRKRLGTAIADAGDNDVLTHGPERERDHHSFCLELLMRTWPLSLLLIGVIALAIAVQFPPAESAMSDAVPLDPLALAVETQVEVIRRSGSLVTFVATNGTRTELRALLGSTPIEEQSPDRRTLPATITRSTDFILPTEDLPADVTRGVALEFAGGKYQPVSLNGEPLSRDSGRHGLLTRIHTTRVADL